MNRREFLHKCACSGAAIVALGGLAGCSRGREAGEGPTATGTTATSPATTAKVGNNRWDPGLVDVDLAVARDKEPAELVRAALDSYGGIDAWVQRGDTVVIKPNLAWAREPAQAATTNPQVLAAVISLCQEAQAGQVIVVEHPCDTSLVSFEMSGAQAVCRDAGVPLLSLENDRLYRELELTQSPNISRDLIAKDILDCDVYINLPIAKVHNAAVATLALKNQMGAVWDRQRYHSAGAGAGESRNLHQNIAGLGASLRPTLNIIDATRVLLSSGPKGPGLTKELDTVIVSADIVAADAYAAKLMDIALSEVAHIVIAAEMGLGNADLASLKVATA